MREDGHVNKLRVGEKGLVTTGGVDRLTKTGVVGKRAASLILDHASVVVAATMDARNHPGTFYLTSAQGTVAHTLTLSYGTFNGTNNVATIDAAIEGLLVHFDENGVGTLVLNVGGVALS